MSVKDQKSLNVEDLRSSGYIIQENPRLFTLRLNIPGGNVTLEQMRNINSIAERFGADLIHLTTRQAIQIPNIRFEDLGKITQDLEEVDIHMGTCGPKYRNTMACPGWPECRNGTSTPMKKTRPGTVELCNKIHEKFFGEEGPAKFKIGISGCPNSCSRSHENDIGLIGVSKPKLKKSDCNSCGLCIYACKEGAMTLEKNFPVVDYEVCISCGDCSRNCPTGALIPQKEGYDLYFGGRMGRHPQLAKRLFQYTEEKTILEIVEKSIDFFRKEGEVGERFSSTLNRYGFKNFKEYIQGKR
jgi:dissimilatory sulfite reductase (desulfoviridin) alpha/beta subunit